LARQAGKLRQIAAHTAVIGDAAVEAEPEGAGDEPGCEPITGDLTVRSNVHLERSVTPVVGFETHAAVIELQPVLGIMPLEVIGIENALRVGHQIAVLEFLVVIRPLGEFSQTECLRLLALHSRPAWMVFLSTLAAEAEIDQATFAIPRFDLLAVERDEPGALRLQRRMDVPGAADELM